MSFQCFFLWLKSNFCFIDPLCWVHDTGKHGTIFEELYNPIALVVCSPVATYMAVKHIRDAILPFDVVLVMFMAMEYGTKVFLLFDQFYKRGGFNGMLGPFDGRDMDEQEDVFCIPVFIKFLGQPFQIGRKVFTFFIGCGGKQQYVFLDDHIKVQWGIPSCLPFLFGCKIMIALRYIVFEGKFVQCFFRIPKITDVIMDNIAIDHTEIECI